LQRATKGKQPKLPYFCHLLVSVELRIKELSKLQYCTWKGKKYTATFICVFSRSDGKLTQAAWQGSSFCFPQ